MSSPVEQRIEVAPGRFVGWETRGSGPGLLILHGAGRARQHYRVMGALLARHFAVHLVDRNGRGLSLPRDDSAGLAGQARDVAAVLAATGARYIFGHSAGGMVGLAAAQVAPLDGLIVYEPGISIDGSFPVHLARDVVDTIDKGNLAAGQVALARAVGALPGWLPDAPLVWGLSALLAAGRGSEMRELLPLVRPDLQQAVADDGPASRFAGLAMPVLVMWGARSPAFLSGTAQRLREALPRGQGVELPGQGHNAPDITAPPAVARHIRRFLVA